MKLLKKTLEFILLSCLAILPSCLNIHQQPKGFDEAIKQCGKRPKIERLITEKKQPISIPQNLAQENFRDWELSLDFDKYIKHKNPLEPDRVYIELNAPVSYRLRDEKQELKISNNLISIFGFKGKIKSFSRRSPEENAYLGIGFEKDTKLIDKKYGKFLFKTGIAYGKDEVKNHIPHSFLPLALDVNIANRLFGSDFGFVYEPNISANSELFEVLRKLKIQPYLEGIASYKHLDVSVDARLNNIPLPLNLNSSGDGVGMAIRAGIKKHLPYFPENSRVNFYIGARDERISGRYPSDNVGFDAGIALEASLK